jgi:hypothetical protein
VALAMSGFRSRGSRTGVVHAVHLDRRDGFVAPALWGKDVGERSFVEKAQAGRLVIWRF